MSSRWLLGALCCLLLLAACGDSPTGQAYRPGDVIPASEDYTLFAPPWSVFDERLFLNVTVSEGTHPQNLEVNVEAKHPDMLFHRTFYVYQNVSYQDSWKAFNFTEQPLPDTNWIPKKATRSQLLTRSSLDRENWAIVYACENVSGRWKCGCATPTDYLCEHWSIQNFPKPRVGGCIMPIPGQECYNEPIDTPFCRDGVTTHNFTCKSGTEFDDLCYIPVNQSCGLGKSCHLGMCLWTDCTPDENVACYSGNSSTRGVGACRDGTLICGATGTWGDDCIGEVTPKAEICGNNKDDDCDGKSDKQDSDCAASYACTDTDHGVDYYTQGKVTEEMTSPVGPTLREATDECDGDLLTEYYCNASQQIASIEETCEGECRRGACSNSTCGDGVIEGSEVCELGDLAFTIFTAGAEPDTAQLTDRSLPAVFQGSIDIPPVKDVSVLLNLSSLTVNLSKKGNSTLLPLTQEGWNYTGSVTAETANEALGLAAGDEYRFQGPDLGDREECADFSQHTSGVLSCHASCWYDRRDCEPPLS